MISKAHNDSYEDIKNAATESNTYISSIKAVVPSDPRVRRKHDMTMANRHRESEGLRLHSMHLPTRHIA
jgi:hypothetical protein